MKKKKTRGTIKINPSVRKKLFSDDVKPQKVEKTPVVVYKKEKSPLKAIRVKCLQCCGDSKHEVKFCPSERCPLWPFRFGKNPFSKRVLTDEQRAAAGERLKKAREARLSASNDKKPSRIRKTFTRGVKQDG